MVDSLTITKKIPGATRGVRVGGTILGASLATLVAGTHLTMPGSTPTWMLLLALAISLWVAIRPWTLTVVKRDDGFVVRSWFRNHHFRRGEVESIDINLIYSMGVGVGVGFIPFVGSVRMVEVITADGRIVWLSCLLGRRNAVLRLVRVLRPLVGLSSAHSTSQS